MKKGDAFVCEFVVDKSVYEGFIHLFSDKNPLHTDAGFAGQKGFPAVVMHGNILGGFLSYFVGECLPEKNVIIHSQEINFRKPVFLNDRLQFKAKIVEVFESVKTIEFSFSFENERHQKVAKGKLKIVLV